MQTIDNLADAQLVVAGLIRRAVRQQRLDTALWLAWQWKWIEAKIKRV